MTEKQPDAITAEQAKPAKSKSKAKPKRRRLPGGKQGQRRAPPQVSGKGRPPMLNEEIAERIYDLAEQGVPDQAIAQVIGVAKSTLSGWYAKGCAAIADGDDSLASELYVNFANRLHAAKGQAIATRISRINSAAAGGSLTRRKVAYDREGNEIVDESYAPPDWRADQWLLQASLPEVFSTKTKVEHSGTVSHQHAHIHTSDMQAVPEGRLLELSQAIRGLLSGPAADPDGDAHQNVLVLPHTSQE